jgi:hypothetical protein
MDPDRKEHIDGRDETLTEACTLCRRPKAACKPADADTPVCRRCALNVLPRLIAQAVLADPDTGQPMHDAMMATAEVRENYCYAVAYYAHYYETAFEVSRFGDGSTNDGHGWEGPDDDEDADWDEWPDDDAGEGPLPASAMPGGVEADQARQVGDGTA